MGHVKRIMMELMDRSDWPQGPIFRHVCAHHFEDRYLNDLISTHGKDGECSYCGRHDIVQDMDKFRENIAWKVAMYFSPLDEAGLISADGFYDDENEVIPGFKRIDEYVVPEENIYFESKYDLLNFLGLITDDDRLNTDIQDIFLTEKWISKDIFEENKEIRFSNQWDRFANAIKRERRFTFLALPEFLPIIRETDNTKSDILSVLHSLIIEQGLCTTIPKGETFYRARKVSEPKNIYKFDDITSPPDNYAVPNRMSPAGISMFYASYEKGTAMDECSGDNTKEIIVGEFKTKEELNVIDLTRIPQNSFWMKDWQGNQFLHKFHSIITTKVEATDKNLINYIPSQAFTEYLRYIFTNSDGKPIDGIIYSSSKTSEKNIVLFYNQKNSHKILDENVKIERYVSYIAWKKIQ